MMSVNRSLIAATCLLVGTSPLQQGKQPDSKASAPEPAIQSVAFDKTDMLLGSEDPALSALPQVLKLLVIDPPVEIREELSTTFPHAALSGWQLNSSRAFDVMLELEDARSGLVARHVHLELKPNSPLRLVSCLEPAKREDHSSLKLTLYRVGQHELVEVFHTAIQCDDDILGVKEGWAKNDWTDIFVPSLRRPLGVWSWNPGTDLALQFALLRGNMWITGIVPDPDWFNKPLAEWPHPIWALNICVLPTDN